MVIHVHLYVLLILINAIYDLPWFLILFFYHVYKSPHLDDETCSIRLHPYLTSRTRCEEKSLHITMERPKPCHWKNVQEILLVIVTRDQTSAQ